MAGNNFRYDLMVEEALRGVVSKALNQAATDGLTEGHHFYITFRTDHPGVLIPDYLRDKYPKDITIVLEHKFWDLLVAEDHFSVTLSFQKNPENLVVPFPALLSFADPSVNFVLQFNTETGTGHEPAPAPAADRQSIRPSAVRTVGGEEKTGEVIALDAFRKK